MINSYHDHHHDMMISIFMIIWLWSTLRHRALFLIRPTIDMSGVYTCKVDLSFINNWFIVDNCLYMIWLDCLHVQGWSLIVTINFSWERCWPDHASFMPGTCSCKEGKMINCQRPVSLFSLALSERSLRTREMYVGLPRTLDQRNDDERPLLLRI